MTDLSRGIHRNFFLAFLFFILALSIYVIAKQIEQEQPRRYYSYDTGTSINCFESLPLDTNLWISASMLLAAVGLGLLGLWIFNLVRKF